MTTIHGQYSRRDPRLSVRGLWCLAPLSKNIAVISWRSVLLVGDTTDLSQVTDKHHHKMLYRAHHVWSWFELTTLVGISTYFLGIYKPNFHTTTTKQSHSVLKMYLLKTHLNLQIKSFNLIYFYFFINLVKPFIGSISLRLRIIWGSRSDMEVSDWYRKCHV